MSHTIEWTASAHHDFNRTLKDVSSKKPNFSGELPFGLKLKDDGTLSGKPREVGIFSFKVKTDDGTGTPGEQDVVLKVNWNKKIDFISTMPLSSSGTSATSTTSNSDLQKYPFLISSACCNEAGGGRVPESMNLGSGLNRTIEMAFREVLGRVPSTRDPRSFVTALNQSFDIRQVEGHAEFTWNPRGYAGQTDLGGGVTGYQASLYKRATVMLDNALPLLDGLYTLNTNTDKEDSEAVRIGKDMITNTRSTSS